MARRWFPRRDREAQERSGAAGGDIAEARREPPPSPYSIQYETIIAQGHERPPPAFGAPALVWHVGIWPRRYQRGASTRVRCDPHDTPGERHAEARRQFEERRSAWVDHIKGILQRVQAKGCDPAGGPARGGAKELTLGPPHDIAWRPTPDDPEHFFKPVEVLEQAVAPFTLWWPDGNEASDAARRANAIRICVHPEVNADYACISFYMDVGQRWNEAHDPSPEAAQGVRRLAILAAVADVRAICQRQLAPASPNDPAPVDQPAVPEDLRCPEGRRTAEELHEALLRARNLLYVDVWELFCREMDCGIDAIAGDRGDVFANFRGLVMSAGGLDDDLPARRPQGRETASVGTTPFPHFSKDARFTADGAEANAVAKAFWPFVRRITPPADYREFIACGVLGWRAIYITALGSASHYVEGQERQRTLAEGGESWIRVPGDLLSAQEASRAAARDEGFLDSLVRPRVGRSGNNHPVRYLILTKLEPHPRQIGRIAERINTMGTFRLYALKDWSAIRNADPYIRILGQELDQITEDWGKNRELINQLRSLRQVRELKREIDRLRREDKRFKARAASPLWTRERLTPLLDALPRYTPRKPANVVIRFLLWLRFIYSWKRYRELMRGMENDLVADIRHSALYEISNKVETDLINISAKLDRMGFGAIGGLHFRLNRSAYYVREFYILLKTLQVANIPTWVSYEQFVRRGLAPAFDYVASVGKRLRAVRTRLLTVTETIETSALVGQSAATRHNTAVLRQTTAFAIIFLIIYLARGQLWWAAQFIGSQILKRLPPQVLSLIDAFKTYFQNYIQ